MATGFIIQGLRTMFRVKCPVCGGVLMIDPRTRKVVSHLTAEQAAQKPAERLESLMEKVKKSKAEQESRLEEAKRREAEREKRLDALFREAQEKAAESGENAGPTGPAW